MTASATLPDTVGTVRFRGPIDTPASRLAVTSAVERMDWRSAGPSPRAILLVRRLVGTLDTASPRDAMDFEARLQDQIDRCWRSAVPLDGRTVPATAPAVVARDLVELLAMYLVDCSDGVVALRWWWRSIERHLELGDGVADTLVEHARVAPQVITEIVRRHRRRDILIKLSDPEARRVIAAIAAAHDLPEVADSIGERSEASATPPTAGRSSRQRDERSGRPVVLVPPGAAPAVLQALAIRMVDAPVSARSHGFVSQLITGAAVDDLSHDADGELPVGPATDAGSDATNSPQAFILGSSAPASSAEGSSAHPAATPNDVLAGPVVSMEPETDELNRERMWRAKDTREVTTDHVASAVDILDTPGAAVEWADPRNAGTDTESIADGVVSALGGVFFLVELARQLDLPDVFEPTWKLSSTVGAWGALELVARSLLPFTAADQRDPIWEVLADLGGGHAGLELARSLPARRPATIPTGWPTAGTSAGASWSIDDTLARDARQGARRLLRTVVPAIGSILAERLDCEIDALPDALFRRPSLLAWGRTHVDVHLPLDSATVEVRRAGFDRDPGWVPAFGRVITFHFDDELPPGRPV